jgi:hypothetical protein
MREEANRLPSGDDDATPKTIQRDRRLGAVRGDLIDVNDPDRQKVEGRADDFKEDPVARLIQSGQARVAPEYREALADYYKAVSK